MMEKEGELKRRLKCRLWCEVTAEGASVLRIIRVELLKKVVFEQGPTPGEKGVYTYTRCRPTPVYTET